MGAEVSSAAGAPDPWHPSNPPSGSPLFVDDDGDERFRQGSDLLLIVASAVGLAFLVSVAVPVSGLERAGVALLSDLPGSVAELAELTLSLLLLWPLFLLVAALRSRRWRLLGDVAAAAVAAMLLSLVVGRLAQGSWSTPAQAWRLDRASEWVPSLRLAVLVAVLSVTSPHLTLPGRRTSRWAVVVSVAAVALAGTSPSAVVAGLLVGIGSAATVHYAVGSSRGRPSLAHVADALVELGVDARRLGAADRQSAGVYVVDAEGAGGERLVVKVYGRDAHDTQVLTTFWRALWYRDPGASVAIGRLRQVEHEALITFLAAQAGVRAPTVIAAGETVRDDAVLVLEDVGTPLEDEPDGWGDAVARGVWAAVDGLHRRRLTHGAVDDRRLARFGDGHATTDGPATTVGFGDLRGARVAGDDVRVRQDEAQALVATALGLGTERALPLALEVLGPDRVEALLPFIQLPALTPHQRQQVKERGVDVDALRQGLAELASLEAPELVELRRVRPRSIAQAGLFVVAFFALASAFAGLDLGELWSELQGATFALVLAGFLVAQATRVAQAVSTRGASPSPIALGPLYALQLASSYIALAVPSTAGRIALNVRFFQRRGLAPGTALAVGAIDGVFGFLVQAVLLAGILLTGDLAGGSLELEMSGGASSGLVRLVAVVFGLGFAALVVVLALPSTRERLLGWVREATRDARDTVAGLRSPRRLAQLVGGNLGSELLFATALGLFVRSLGFSVDLTELILVNVSVSLLAGLLPVPGGIGVVEGGLTYGLVRAGVPEEAALAAVLFYRFSTFYVPPVWGVAAFRWLERREYL